jgi:riboflavin kinase/FMN adenylyltransferase
MNNKPLSDEVAGYLASGDMPRVTAALGQPFILSGMVVHGNHLGRTLGFPTANLDPGPNPGTIPARGVYAVTVEFGGETCGGMANIGIRPTIDGTRLTIEVHLFNFSGDLYGTTLAVSFIGRIRDEQRFNSLDDLVEQIRRDKSAALKLLS